MNRLPDPASEKAVAAFLAGNRGRRIDVEYRRGDEVASEEDVADVDVSLGGNRAVVETAEGRRVTVDVAEELEEVVAR